MNCHDLTRKGGYPTIDAALSDVESALPMRRLMAEGAAQRWCAAKDAELGPMRLTQVRVYEAAPGNVVLEMTHEAEHKA